MERAWLQLEMTVQIVTKLNRGSIIHGRAAYLLPCLGRIEIDRQASGVQFVTVEDTTGRFHASHGQAEPAGEHILSEPKIVAELAKATLAPNPKVEIDPLGAAGDAVPRAVRGLRVVTCHRAPSAGYYPECNPLLPLWHHAEGSHVPAAKSIPVRVQKRG